MMNSNDLGTWGGTSYKILIIKNKILLKNKKGKARKAKGRGISIWKKIREKFKDRNKRKLVQYVLRIWKKDK
jgi:hypothetical protein